MKPGPSIVSVTRRMPVVPGMLAGSSYVTNLDPSRSHCCAKNLLGSIHHLQELAAAASFLT